MKIVNIDSFGVALPFEPLESPTGFGGSVWNDLRHLLVRIELASGVIGWGEAYAYGAIESTQSALHTIVKPLVLNKEIDNIGHFMETLRQITYIYGLAGPIKYAISGIDIALWDALGKQSGKSIASMLGGVTRTSIDAYKSLMRLDSKEAIVDACRLAEKEGYTFIKLHDNKPEVLRVAADAVGANIRFMLDVNASWSLDEALNYSGVLRAGNVVWIEEPIWPPNDFDKLARFIKSARLPVATGESFGGVVEFAKAVDDTGVSYIQPSVTKIGGISETIKVLRMAQRCNTNVVLHSPYFGPGLLATLQLAGSFNSIELVEILGVALGATFFGQIGLPDTSGRISIPTGPGLGCDPDWLTLSQHKI